MTVNEIINQLKLMGNLDPASLRGMERYGINTRRTLGVISKPQMAARALRQVGKHNIRLNKLAIESAKRIKNVDSKAARCIAADALCELTSDKIMGRLDRKSN